MDVITPFGATTTKTIQAGAFFSFFDAFRAQGLPGPSNVVPF